MSDLRVSVRCARPCTQEVGRLRRINGTLCWETTQFASEDAYKRTLKVTDQMVETTWEPKSAHKVRIADRFEAEHGTGRSYGTAAPLDQCPPMVQGWCTDHGIVDVSTAEIRAAMHQSRTKVHARRRVAE